MPFSEIMGDEIRDNKDLKRWFKNVFKKVPVEDVYTVAVSHSFETPVPERLFKHKVIAGPKVQHGKIYLVLGYATLRDFSKDRESDSIENLVNPQDHLIKYGHDRDEPVINRTRRSVRRVKKATFAKIKQMLRNRKRSR